MTVWIEWETHRQCVSWPYVLQTGTQVHWCAQGWELEHGDWRVILGWGLLLTAGRWPEGKKEGNLKQRMPLERNQVAMEAGCYCWVMHCGWNHHYSPFLPSCWPWQLCNREGQARAVLWVPTVPSNREGPVRETLWVPVAKALKKYLIEPYLLHPWVLSSWHTWHCWDLCDTSSHAISMPSPHQECPKSSRATPGVDFCG